MTVEEFHAAGKERYWKGKDLHAARESLEKGIALAQVQRQPDFEKPLQYDLASFCWPGWDDPGIEIGKDDLLAGARAAVANLSLAQSLERGARPMANAFFMVGAYHLVRRQYSEARQAFAHQEEQAGRAGDPAGQTLAAGYANLADGLSREQVELGPTLDRLRLSGWEHGESFAAQLETAARVFGR